jgi:hypothetical protein
MHPRTARLPTIAVLAAACLAPSVVAAAPGHAVPAVAANPAVIAEWNAIAARTFAENATPIPVSGLYYGFVSIAVYDAVVAIEGGYEPYVAQPPAPRQASSEVAAVTAAYRVLSHYFPASAAKLAQDHSASLADVTDGVGLTQGERVGEAAADAIIRLRQDDGRDAPITLDVDPAPGVWRPTPDAFAPMLGAWLGFVQPLALKSPTQIRLPGPHALSTESYARDFAEVKAYGSPVGTSARDAAQTQTALFWNANLVLQLQVALRDQMARRGLDILASSRAFALLNTANADSVIACWRAKYDYAYWRPITAIRLADTDGNAATEPDPAWKPLAITPPYPDYTSGHACITAAASHTLSYLFGASSLDLDISSSVTSTSRHYDTADALEEETMNARIWLGIHFRKAMTDGNQLGHQVAAWTIRHQFGPTD